jgi:hypothetical protein
MLLKRCTHSHCRKAATSSISKEFVGYACLKNEDTQMCQYVIEPVLQWTRYLILWLGRYHILSGAASAALFIAFPSFMEVQ